MPGKLEAIYISPKSAEPMQELQQVNLIAGKGLEGDRYNYALQTGTYSAGFIDEPGKNCTASLPLSQVLLLYRALNGGGLRGN